MKFPDIAYAILLVSLLMGVTLTLGYTIGADKVESAREFHSQYASSATTKLLHTFGSDINLYFAIILINNLLIDCIFFFSVRALPGRAVALTPFFVAAIIGYNGLLIGAVLYLGVASYGWFYTIAAILPHGILELTAMILAASLGLTYAFRILEDESNRIGEFRKYAGAFVTVVVPMVVAAALIEAYVTHTIIGSLA